MTRHSFIRTLILSGFLAILTSCVHYQERLNLSLDPWLGRHPDQLVEQWGAPDSTYVMENGVKVLTYTTDRTVGRFSALGYPSWRFGNYTYSDSCKMSFFSEAGQKKIERYSTTGEAASCVEILKDLPPAK